LTLSDGLVEEVPWVSVACTVKVCTDLGESPVIANEVPVAVAMGTPSIDTV
jgi:hypothetical protein